LRLESRILELDGGSPGSLTALSHDSRYHYHRLVQELLHAAPEPDGCNPPGVLCVCNQETRSSKLGLVLHSTYCKQESRTGSKKQGGHDFLEEAPWRTSVPDAPVDAERMLSAPLLSVVLALPVRDDSPSSYRDCWFLGNLIPTPTASLAVRFAFRIRFRRFSSSSSGVSFLRPRFCLGASATSEKPKLQDCRKREARNSG